MGDTPTTVAKMIVDALKRHDVDTLFGQSLPSALVLAAEGDGIRQVAYRQENAGGAMADGYARFTGKVGIVLAQNGPAAALLVAPLAEALKASVPVIALVQEVERPQVDRNAFQELDHQMIFSGCAKYVRRIDRAGRVEDYVDAAFTAATSGRPGPAVLLLPADLLREEAVPQQFPRRANLGHWPLDRQIPGEACLSEAADLIAGAERPVVIAGGGVQSSGGGKTLEALCDRHGLPVFTTNMGKGSIDETHPLACGVLGALNGPRSIGSENRAIMDEADVVLIVGSRTNQNGTDSWRGFPSSARFIHIDVDPMEIGRTYEAVRLVGDAAETLAALNRHLAQRPAPSRTASRSELESRIATGWALFEEKRQIHSGSNKSPIRPERVMAELQQLLSPEMTVVADASYSSMWLLGQLRGAASGSRFLTPRGLAGLGWGVPMAMGVAAAKPEHPVIALVGDGGFGHNWSEIETMVRSKLPVIVILLNNGVLGFQKDAETVKFGCYTSACTFAPVNHTAVADACGCRNVRIENVGDIGPALSRAIAEAGTDGMPWFIEVLSDPDAHPALSLFDGTLDRA